LESDRVAALLVELSANGVVDFKNANLLDRKWQLRLKWLAKSYMARKNADVVKLAILRYTGALGYGTAEMFNEAWDGMTGLFENYMESSLPWREKDS
jgi:hypothetical protein